MSLVPHYMGMHLKVTAVKTSNINQKYTYMVQGETEKTNSGGSTQNVPSCVLLKTIMQLWNNNITYSVWLIQECDQDWHGGDIMEFWCMDIPHHRRIEERGEDY